MVNMVGFSGRNVKSPLKQRSERPVKSKPSGTCVKQTQETVPGIAPVPQKDKPVETHLIPRLPYGGDALPPIKPGGKSAVSGHYPTNLERDTDNRREYQGTTVGFLLDVAEEKSNRKGIPVRSNLGIRKSSMFRTEDFERVKAQQDLKDARENRLRSASCIARKNTQMDKSDGTTSTTTATETETSSEGNQILWKSSLSPRRSVRPATSSSHQQDGPASASKKSPDDEDASVHFERHYAEPRTRQNPDLFIPMMRDLGGLGLDYDPRARISAVPQQERGYELPDLTRHKLSDVKHSIYNPDIKTFRAMADDEKFGWECGTSLRHSTRASREDFALAEAGVYRPQHMFNEPGPPGPPCLSLQQRSNTLAEVRHAQEVWQSFIDQPQSDTTHPRETLHADIYRRLKDFRFENQILKLGKRPQHAARYTMKSEPSLQGYQQRPLSQDVLNRYR